jgi:hypothetical protein
VRQPLIAARGLALAGAVLVVTGAIALAVTGDSVKSASLPAVLLAGGVIALAFSLRRFLTVRQAGSPRRVRGALVYGLLLLMVAAVATGARFMTQPGVSAGLRTVVAVLYLVLPALNLADFCRQKLRDRGRPAPGRHPQPP